MARVTYEYTEYKHSKFATFCSRAGSWIVIFSLFLGISGMFAEGGGFGSGLVVIVIGVGIGLGLSTLGDKIGTKASFDSWWQQVENAGLIPEMVNSSETAIAVYKKNPCPQTLEKIQQLNPAAAAYIRTNNVK